MNAGDMVDCLSIQITQHHVPSYLSLYLSISMYLSISPPIYLYTHKINVQLGWSEVKQTMVVHGQGTFIFFELSDRGTQVAGAWECLYSQNKVRYHAHLHMERD